ncbi:MAG: hypothetical protein JRI47_02940 [Deltaproteobacteria bacterium]|nr:hypothetical protein [Deltaproteobacteria bacterium]
MDFLQSTELSVPLIQIVLMLSISTLALLGGRVKLALLVNYLFTLYWGYIFNLELLVGENLEKMDYFFTFYFGFGLLVVVLALIGFLQGDN